VQTHHHAERGPLGAARLEVDGQQPEEGRVLAAGAAEVHHHRAGRTEERREPRRDVGTQAAAAAERVELVFARRLLEETPGEVARRPVERGGDAPREVARDRLDFRVGRRHRDDLFAAREPTGPDRERPPCGRDRRPDQRAHGAEPASQHRADVERPDPHRHPRDDRVRVVADEARQAPVVREGIDQADTPAAHAVERARAHLAEHALAAIRRQRRDVLDHRAEHGTAVDAQVDDRHMVVAEEPRPFLGDHHQRRMRPADVLPLPERRREAGALLAAGLGEDVQHAGADRVGIGRGRLSHAPGRHGGRV